MIPDDLSRPHRNADLVFFDSECGFCQSWIRWTIRHDDEGLFRFAPIGGETFQAMVPDELIDAPPRSVLVLRRDGEIMIKSRAALYIAEHLGLPVRVLARAAGLIPTVIRDGVYDLIARNRYRVMREEEGGACTVPSRRVRSRLLP